MKTKSTTLAIRYFLLVGASIAIVLPLAWAVTTALLPLEDVYADSPRFIPYEPAWSNFWEAWTRLPMTRFVINALLIAVPSVFGAVLTSAMAGYAFARFRWRGKRMAFGLLVASILVPTQLLLVPHFLMFSGLGWINTYKPMIVPAWLGGGAFNILLFRQFFRSMGTELEDAARLEGATEWTAFLRVALPAAKPAVAVVAILSFAFHWNDFIRPLIYLSDFEAFPISLGLRMYQTASGSWMNLVMAASLLSIIPVLAIFLMLQRHLASSWGE